MLKNSVMLYMLIGNNAKALKDIGIRCLNKVKNLIREVQKS